MFVLALEQDITALSLTALSLTALSLTALSLTALSLGIGETIERRMLQNSPELYLDKTGMIVIHHSYFEH